MNINYFDGMFNISSGNVNYGLLEEMYKTGHGVGLQCNETDPDKTDPDKRELIEQKCLNVYKAVKELDNLL